MKEESWWYRAIADSPSIVFAGAMGVGAGAFLAVAIGAVNPGGEALRIYLGAMTAMIGGGIGIFGSRLLDRLSDRRRLRRNTFRVRLRLWALARSWENFANFLAELAERQRNEQTSVPAEEQHSQAVACLILAAMVYRTALDRPNFDEVVETVVDLNHAEIASQSFGYAEEMFSRPSKLLAKVQNDKETLQSFPPFDEDFVSLAREHIETLEGTDRYFAQRGGYDHLHAEAA